MKKSGGGSYVRYEPAKKAPGNGEGENSEQNGPWSKTGGDRGGVPLFGGNVAKGRS